MTEFSPRTEPVASVASAKERGIQQVRGTTPPPAGNQPDAQAQIDTQLTQRSAATADYVKLQANIADAVARLDPPSPNGAQLAREADKSLVALMPEPVAVLPMPPTDQDMIEFVAQVAQSVASQAAMARAAQAHISSAVADALVTGIAA